MKNIKIFILITLFSFSNANSDNQIEFNKWKNEFKMGPEFDPIAFIKNVVGAAEYVPMNYKLHVFEWEARWAFLDPSVRFSFSRNKKCRYHATRSTQHVGTH